MTFSRWTHRAVAVLAVSLLTTLAAASPGWASPRAAAAPVALRIIAMNDFHGNLEQPTGSSGRVVLSDGTTVNAGGAAFIATHIAQLKAQVAHSLVVSSGDNIGASPLASALFHDEPTIEFLNDIGLSASAVGNHEFDEGYAELRRIQFGGCHPTDGCQFRPTYTGAKFPILGANVTFNGKPTDASTRGWAGLPALYPFTIDYSSGVPVGIIGVTLRDLPSIVIASGIRGLQFGDEVGAINRTSDLLDFIGVKAQLVVMHQGDEDAFGTGPTGPNDCTIVPGPATAIAKAVTSKVDAIFTGHTHQQYKCVINDPAGQPRPMIQGLSFGRLLSVVDLKIDPVTKDVIRSATVANNVIVTQDVVPDPTVSALVTAAMEKSAPISNRAIGSITADIVRAAPPSGEEPLGDVIADGQLAATTNNGAQIAITNPGGIRADLTFASSTDGEGDGVVTYGEAFTVQPFSNIMQTVTMTGAQLDAVLEQQWQPQPNAPLITRILQISSTLHYTQAPGNPIGSRISNLSINGQPVSPTASYRVSINNFLAGGGDGFTVFESATNVTAGPIDIDAFTAYLTAHPHLAPPPADRITVA